MQLAKYLHCKSCIINIISAIYLNKKKSSSKKPLCCFSNCNWPLQHRLSRALCALCAIIIQQRKTKGMPIKFDSTNRKYSRHVHKTNQIVYNSQTKQFNMIMQSVYLWPLAWSYTQFPFREQYNSIYIYADYDELNAHTYLQKKVRKHQTKTAAVIKIIIGEAANVLFMIFSQIKIHSIRAIRSLSASCIFCEISASLQFAN